MSCSTASNGSAQDPYPWLLDSALPSARLGRYSFAGSDPYLVLRARGTDIELDCRRDVRPGLVPGRSRFAGDPLDALRALRPPPPVRARRSPYAFVGGAVGYLGYELAGRISRSSAFCGEDDLDLPDLYLPLRRSSAVLRRRGGALQRPRPGLRSGTMPAL